MAPQVNILLVDDQEADLLALEAVLAPLGQNLLKARSGPEALRHLLHEDFAVLVLDVRMEGMSGFETARLVRERERSRHTPIIFLTAGESPDLPAARAYSLGAVDHLVKPVAPEVLRAKVDVFVQLFRKTEQVRQLEAQRQAEEVRRASERRFRAVIENSYDAIALLAADGTIRYVSPSNTRLGGFAAEEVLGRSAFAYIHPDDLARVQERFAQLLQLPGGSLTAQYRSLHKDGTWLWIEGTGTNLLTEPSVQALVVNFRDITAQKEADKALRERAAALAEANRQKDQFLAMLAHELRSPLAPLANGLHILRQPQTTPQLCEQTRDMMARQLRHLARLVDDLLDVSCILRGKVQLRRERLDLGRLVRTTAEDRRPVLEQAGLTLRLEIPETPVWVQGDGTRLAQVLNNLLDNVVKFADGGRGVTVRVAADAGRREAVLCVRDQGIGIDPGMLPRLFDPFIQADRSLERSRGGLGLGLALVRGLVELHGGRVEAASEGPGRGAEFAVRLPLEAEPAALAQPPAEPPPARKHCRILVVEDNRDAAESLRLLLELIGHEVRVAHTGPEGLRVAHDWRPEVVLCDIGLPGLDGYGVARELRLDPTTARVRLLALTGYGTDEDRRRSRQAGFDHHLVKPADPEELQRLLASG